MSFPVLILLNLACIFEAFVMHYLIHNGYIYTSFPRDAPFLDLFSFIAVKNIIVLGIYQLYFWPQKNINDSRIIQLKTSKIDDMIPSIPQAVWIYSPFYYIVFNLAFFCVEEYHFGVLNAWVMLMHACFWFKLFPTRLPKGFREKLLKKKMDPVTRLLIKMVQQYDSEENAIPSMHCAFAAFTAFVMYPFYPNLAFAFPGLVALSCLFCKQHLIIDIIPGLALGLFHGFLYKYLEGILL